MEIRNIDGLSVAQVKQLVNEGGRFVHFPYTISIVLMTFKRSSSIYFVRDGENSFKYSYKHVGTNLVLGWWGLPWGPIYTIGSLYHQLSGGKDVTDAVMSQLIQHDPEANTSTYAINDIINPNASNSSTSTTTSNSPYNVPRN